MSDNPQMFDGVHDARSLIEQAIGAGSVCWDNPAGAGVFDSENRVSVIADAAWNRLRILLADQFSEDRGRG